MYTVEKFLILMSQNKLMVINFVGVYVYICVCSTVKWVFLAKAYNKFSFENRCITICRLWVYCDTTNSLHLILNIFSPYFSSFSYAAINRVYHWMCGIDVGIPKLTTCSPYKNEIQSLVYFANLMLLLSI